MLSAADAAPHGAAIAKVPGDGPSVDTGDPDDALPAKLVLEWAPGAPVTRDARGIADDVAGDPDPPRLVVFVVPPCIADVRSGLDHDLTVVTRIGERLLITGHPGGEDSLTECQTLSAVRL